MTTQAMRWLRDVRSDYPRAAVEEARCGCRPKAGMSARLNTNNPRHLWL